jgi:hypothetical protein
VGGSITDVHTNGGDMNTHGILQKLEVSGSPSTSDNNRTDMKILGMTFIKHHEQVEGTSMEK